MRKLKLEIDELRVETFATETRKAGSGTVWGNMPFEMPASDESHCGDVCGGSGSDPNSGYQTCPCTLRWSCNGSCDICTVIECPTQATYCC